MDKVMLRSMSNYTSLGLYAVAATVAASLGILQSCFTSFWIPVAHQWRAEHVDNSRFVRIGRMVTCVMSIIFVCVLLFKDVIFIFFKSDYSDASVIVPFLLFTPIMYTISEVTVMGIYFKEKTIWTVFVSIISSGINLVLNWILIPLWGGIGAAVATGVSYIVFFWCRTIFSRRIWFDFPLKDYVFITILLLITAAVNSFFTNWFVYVVNLVSLALLLFYFRRDVTEIFSIGFDYVKTIV